MMQGKRISDGEIRKIKEDLLAKMASAQRLILSSKISKDDFLMIRRIHVQDKISASTISKEYEHLSMDLINACLFGVPAVSGYLLFQSDMSAKPEIQEKSGVVDKAKAIGSAWAALAGSTERLSYETAAEKLRKVYDDIDSSWSDFLASCEWSHDVRPELQSVSSTQRLRHASDEKVAERGASIADRKAAPKRIPAPKKQSAVQIMNHSLAFLKEKAKSLRGPWYAQNWHLFAPFLPDDLRSRSSRLAVQLIGVDSTGEGSSGCSKVSGTREVDYSRHADLAAKKAAAIVQPRTIVNGTMFPYQLEGLQWMVRQHSFGVGGILGDEMGLGKTLQVISFLAYLKETGDSGPYIIVAPLSVLPTWQGELQRWCPSLKVIQFHGNGESRAQIWQDHLQHATAGIDVIITTYEMVVADTSKLAYRTYSYVILDEAQRIKNDQSLIGQAARRLRGVHKILITGTPLQNDMHELWALLNFLLPEVFESCEMFDNAFSTRWGKSTHMDSKLVAAAHRLLQPLMLRRLKCDVQKELPPKTILTVWCPLTTMQKFWYKQFLMHAGSLKSQVDGGAQWKKLLNLLMQLRKVVNHPYMFAEAEEKPGETDDTIVTNSAKMMVLDKLLWRLKEGGHRVLVYSQFTQMLDIIEDYCNFVGHSYMRLDGGTCLARRKYEIQLFNSGNGGQFIYLLSTRAGALGITLTGADTVIMYDSDWNPTWDRQAHGRVHRIGQTKPVTVYQLLCQETVEELMFARAQQKISLNEMVLRDYTEAPEDDDSAKPLSGKEIRDMLKCGARRILASSVDDEMELSDAVIEGIISAAASVHDIDPNDKQMDEDDGDLFEREMWDIRKFQGKVFSSIKESFRSIADAWAEELLKKPKKREVIATTVEIGKYHVKKINRLVADVAVSGPKKVKREVVRDNLCLFCVKSSSKGLVRCTVRGCHRAFHQSCFDAGGYKCNDHFIGVKCPQHACLVCDGKAGNRGGLLFRCTDCPSTLCESCLPESFEAVDRNEVVSVIGYLAGSIEYIRCSACLMKPPNALYRLLHEKGSSSSKVGKPGGWNNSAECIDAGSGGGKSLSYQHSKSTKSVTASRKDVPNRKDVPSSVTVKSDDDKDAPSSVTVESDDDIELVVVKRPGAPPEPRPLEEIDNESASGPAKSRKRRLESESSPGRPTRHCAIVGTDARFARQSQKSKMQGKSAAAVGPAPSPKHPKSPEDLRSRRLPGMDDIESQEQAKSSAQTPTSQLRIKSVRAGKKHKSPTYPQHHEEMHMKGIP